MTTNRVPTIDRSIYPMPSFVTLSVSDLERSVRFYEAVGFVDLARIPGPEGSDVLVHLRRCRYQDLLLVPSPDHAAGGVVTTFALSGEDPDDLAERVRTDNRVPKNSCEGPVDTPWFSRDVRLTDPDGHQVVMTGPRDMEGAQQWVREGGITGDWRDS